VARMQEKGYQIVPGLENRWKKITRANTPQKKPGVLCLSKRTIAHNSMELKPPGFPRKSGMNSA